MAPSLSSHPFRKKLYKFAILSIPFFSVLLVQEEAPGLGKAAQIQDQNSLAFPWKTWSLELDTASRLPQR